MHLPPLLRVLVHEDHDDLDRLAALANREMKRIEKAVADDQVKQYDIAKRNGDKMQACVQAGFVKAAFLQAKDEGNYKKWMATEKTDCAAAGMPSE